jgi:hypothetical protein
MTDTHPPVLVDGERLRQVRGENVGGDGPVGEQEVVPAEREREAHARRSERNPLVPPRHTSGFDGDDTEFIATNA